MANVITINVDKGDLRRLNAAIAEYARVRKVDNAYAVNRTAKDVAFRAAEYTRRADPEKISADLRRLVSERTTNKRTGGLLKKPVRSYLPLSRARAVFAAAMRKGTLHYKGMPPGKQDPSSLGRGEFDKLLTKYIGRRVSSAAFFAGGWAAAGKKIRAKISTKVPAFLKGKRGRGSAYPARSGIKVSATLINYAASQAKGSQTALIRYAGAAAVRAIRYKTADLVKFTREQLTKQARKFNRR